MSEKFPSHIKNEYEDEYENVEYITPGDTYIASNTKASPIPQQTAQHVPQQTPQQGVRRMQHQKSHQLPRLRPRPMSHLQQRMQRCNRGDFLRNGDSKAETTCGNCGYRGHRLKHCMKQERDGFIHGCPICNTTAHLYDECSSWNLTTTQNRIQKEHLHYLVTMRNNRPPIRTSVDLQTLPGFASSAFRPWTPAFSQAHLGFFLGHKYLARWDQESTIEDPTWKQHATVSSMAWSEHDTLSAPTVPVQSNPAEFSGSYSDNFEGFARIVQPSQSHQETGNVGTEVVDSCFQRQIQSRTHSHPPDRSRHSHNSSVQARRDIPEFPTHSQSDSVDASTMFDHTPYESGTSILNTEMFQPVPGRDSYIGRYVAYSDVHGNRYLVEELGSSPKPNIHPASLFSLLPVGYVLPNSYPAQLDFGSTHVGDATPSRFNHTQSEREHTADLNNNMQTVGGSSATGGHSSDQGFSSKGAPHYRSRP
jgi:hypothetical protein